MLFTASAARNNAVAIQIWGSSRVEGKGALPGNFLHSTKEAVLLVFLQWIYSDLCVYQAPHVCSEQ